MSVFVFCKSVFTLNCALYNVSSYDTGIESSLIRIISIRILNTWFVYSRLTCALTCCDCCV